MPRVTLLGTIVVLMLGGTARAQILTGNIIGTVKDESGGVLPGATVTLASPEALPGGPATVVTDVKGEYRFTLLKPGSYALTVTLDAFAAYREEGLRVAIDSTIERDVVLKVATVAETVTVSGQSPMVDPRSVGTGMTLPQEVFAILPTHRAYFQEQTKWAPGVSVRDPSYVGAGDVSVLGSGTNENTTMYEGIVTDSNGVAFSSSDHDGWRKFRFRRLAPRQNTLLRRVAYSAWSSGRAPIR
jgi:hypothetical protein